MNRNEDSSTGLPIHVHVVRASISSATLHIYELYDTATELGLVTYGYAHALINSAKGLDGALPLHDKYQRSLSVAIHRSYLMYIPMRIRNTRRLRYKIYDHSGQSIIRGGRRHQSPCTSRKTNTKSLGIYVLVFWVRKAITLRSGVQKNKHKSVPGCTNVAPRVFQEIDHSGRAKPPKSVQQQKNKIM